MRKSRKLRSSVKAHHEALTSFRPAAGSPTCFHTAETHPFTSFDSIYYSPPTSSPSSASFSDSCSHHGLLHRPPDLPSTEMRPIYKDAVGEEEAISISATATSSSTCSSCLSSSSIAAAAGGPDDTNAAEADALPSGILCSDRFFFSPCTSKSIMGGPFVKVGSKETEALRSHPYSEPGQTGEDEDEEEEHSLVDMLQERGFDTAVERTVTAGSSALRRESIPMAMASRDPYRDFRSSMEEMVAVHGLRDWPELQEMLRCYLRLNEEKIHRFIVKAFVDLLFHL